MKLLRTLLVPALLALDAGLHSQANTDPEIDVILANVDDLTVLNRAGVFPDGVNACSMSTTACNGGTKEIPWQSAMDPDHPFIAFLVARRSGGRMVQISDRSYVKHAFFALSSSQCSPCSPTDGTKLGIGCSDTYGTVNNGDNYYLGPPDEIDPWLGVWDPFCSHFDRGEPAVAPPNDCNGARSLTRAQANALVPIGHRVQLRDVDLDVPEGFFYYQGMYVVATEGEALRGDNLGSRAFTPTWNGTRWVFSTSPGSTQLGSILSRWQGASVQSATNGADDGRLYVGVRVTGPVDGFYHYEYAVHNRDNARGVGALRVPLCPGARVRAIGFGDIDDDAGNDWSSAVVGNELVYVGASNPLEWNTLFNFWFDSDAAPSASSLALDQAAAGPGQAAVVVGSSAPLRLFNVHLGPGCALDTPPSLHATGTPARATLGNASFALRSTGNAPFQPNTLYFTRTPGSFPLGACTLFLGPSSGAVLAAGTVSSDANGVALHPVPIPNDVALEGLEVDLQLVGRDPGNGALFRDFELSEALRARVGSALGECP